MNTVIDLILEDEDVSDDSNDSDSDVDGYLDDDEMEQLIKRKECVNNGDLDRRMRLNM